MITTIPDRERDLQAQVDALTEELERLRAQEPDAWMDDFGNAFPLAANKGAGSWMDEHKRHWKPLYRAAPPAQPAEPVAWRWKERVNGMSDSDWTVTNVEPPDGVRVIAKEPLYAAQPAPAAVPPGYALVPIEPTHGMLSALTQEWHPSKHGPMKQRYRAMIAAAGDNT